MITLTRDEAKSALPVLKELKKWASKFPRGFANTGERHSKKGTVIGRSFRAMTEKVAAEMETTTAHATDVVYEFANAYGFFNGVSSEGAKAVKKCVNAGYKALASAVKAHPKAKTYKIDAEA